ncbi:hypothetical protein [Stutzerimonas nitrititolerans]|uniref:hypothetical protein n=1 Tax=Stutzerimonas nitrititolerans TaxID=2482751 RepID=UPI00289B8E3A|nr:hypothetical protein [Stutzerimonas nitrititolerans]
MSKEVKRYAERDAYELDKAGNYYFRHVSAMTGEGLHRKSDIAAELGWRGMQIDALLAERDRLREALERVMKWASPLAGDNQDEEEVARELEADRIARAALQGEQP